MRNWLKTSICLLLASIPLTAGVGGGPFVSGIMEGGPGNDAISKMAYLPNGDIVVCGSVPESAPWGDTYGYDSTHGGGWDGFVAIFDNDLTTVKRFTFVGGGQDDVANGLGVQSDGTIIVSGTSDSDDLPTTVGVVGPAHSKDKDGFIIGLTADLSTVEFCTYIVGERDEDVTDLVLDDNDAIYICGMTNSRDDFVTANAIYPEHAGLKDGFIAALSQNGARYLFSTYFGSNTDDFFNDIKVDDAGKIYVAGTTTSASFPMNPFFIDTSQWRPQDELPYDYSYGGGESDAVLVILAPLSADVLTSTFAGGTGDDEGNGVAFFDDGVVLVGRTTSEDIEEPTGQQTVLRGRSDMFMIRLDASGRTFKGSTYFGGYGDEIVDGILTYDPTKLLVWGRTTSTDLPTVGFGTRAGRSGAEEAFFSILTLEALVTSSTFGGGGTELFSDALLEPDGGFLLGGTTSSPFIPLEGEYSLENNGESPSEDAFILRFQQGIIDLSNPKGGTSQCLKNEMQVTWTRNDMSPTDEYFLDVLLDDGWLEVGGPSTNNDIKWTPTDDMFIGRDLRIRIRSSRRHETLLDGTIRFDPEPTFETDLPEEITACAGKPLTLMSEVTGVGITYRWRKDNRVIPDQTENSITLTGDDRDGRYEIEVTANCGVTIVSRTATVTTSEPPAITLQPDSTTVKEDEILELSVAASGDGLEYQWYRTDVKLPKQTNRVLSITGVEPEDAGDYTCVVKNSCGDVTTDVAQVIVSPSTSVAEFMEATSFAIHVSSEVSGRDNMNIHVRNSNGTIEVEMFDVHGRVVATARGTDGQSIIHMPSMSLNTGTYFIVARNGNSVDQAQVFVVH